MKTRQNQYARFLTIKVGHTFDFHRTCKSFLTPLKLDLNQGRDLDDMGKVQREDALSKASEVGGW